MGDAPHGPPKCFNMKETQDALGCTWMHLPLFIFFPLRDYVITVATSAGRGTAERGRGPCQAGEGPGGHAVNCQHINHQTRDTSSGSSGHF